MFTISVEWFNDMFVSHINLNIKRHEIFISFISLSKWKRRNQWIEKWTMHFSSILLTNWNIVKRLTHTENMKKVSSFMSNWFTMRQFLLFLYSPICALACQNQVKPWLHCPKYYSRLKIEFFDFFLIPCIFYGISIQIYIRI